ncbi:uncharacterized protein LOC135935590 [Cloeon dipterum]|uniref:uncharacterized protein LOC135935590 n=1 Tax=Cloeon dipterum TaxID=197152 RepID=UPI0032207B6C
MSRHVRSLYQTPRYRKEWEELPHFQPWLSRGPELDTNQRSGPTTKAYCTFCEDVIEPLYDTLIKHAESKAHQLVAKVRTSTVRNNDVLQATVEEYLRLRRDCAVISSQITDSMTGLPAEGVEVKLYKLNEGECLEMMSSGLTDQDGYLDSLIFHTTQLPVGLFRFEYLIQDYYFRGRRLKTTYPLVQPSFEIKPNMSQYHFRVVIAPHYHSVYLETEKAKQQLEEITDNSADGEVFLFG